MCAIGWGIAWMLYYFESNGKTYWYLPVLFLVNTLRSLPQIIGLFLGYIILNTFFENEFVQSAPMQLCWMAFVMGILCSLEVIDLIQERIAYFTQSDFFHALQCCGMKESRIINVEILRKNSIAHLVQKAVSLFGTSIFLQCSMGFIISVGLSNEISLTNYPVSLGSLLAKLDSKQDILAVGSTLTNPSYFPNLFFQHLQGVSVAAIIIFTLLCIYHIADGLIRTYDL